MKFRIMHNSIMDRLGVVQVGDHLEKLNGQSLVGKRHIQVSRMLKDIPRGSTLVLRLVEPMTRTGFGVIGPRVSGPRSRGKIVSYGSGKETLRFKADGYARIEQVVLYLSFYFTFRLLLAYNNTEKFLFAERRQQNDREDRANKQRAGDLHGDQRLRIG